MAEFCSWDKQLQNLPYDRPLYFLWSTSLNISIISSKCSWHDSEVKSNIASFVRLWFLNEFQFKLGPQNLFYFLYHLFYTTKLLFVPDLSGHVFLGESFCSKPSAISGEILQIRLQTEVKAGLNPTLKQSGINSHQLIKK